MRDHTLEQLWDTAPAATRRFDPASIEQLPAAARSYLLHAIAPGAPLASAARLHMHGTMRLRGAWIEFTATQVLRWDRGFVWRASTRMFGLPISGFDRLVDGEAEMRWKLLGVVPVVTASGPEIARSAAGRLHGEAMWLPTVLLGPDVRWEPRDASHAGLVIHAHGEDSRLELTLDERGAPRSCKLPRWGDLGTGEFRYEDFGVIVEQERCFGGLTIPSRLRVGWYFDTPRFAEEGEFFRCEIDDIEYR